MKKGSHQWLFYSTKDKQLYCIYSPKSIQYHFLIRKIELHCTSILELAPEHTSSLLWLHLIQHSIILLWDTSAAMPVPSCLKANNIRQFLSAQRSCCSATSGTHTASKAFEKSFLEYGYVSPALPCPAISTTEVTWTITWLLLQARSCWISIAQECLAFQNINRK